MVDHIGGIFRAEPRINRMQHRANAANCIIHFKLAIGIPPHHANTVAAFDAHAKQRISKLGNTLSRIPNRIPMNWAFYGARNNFSE